jgi:hypothetical protein
MKTKRLKRTQQFNGKKRRKVGGKTRTNKSTNMIDFVFQMDAVANNIAEGIKNCKIQSQGNQKKMKRCSDKVLASIKNQYQ